MHATGVLLVQSGYINMYTKNTVLALSSIQLLFLTEAGFLLGIKRVMLRCCFIPPDRLKSIISMYRTSGGLAVVAIE